MTSYRYLWNPPPDPNARAYLAVFLATLAMTTLGSFFATAELACACQGYAAFGWLMLVCVLWGGFKLSDIYDALRVIHGCRLGLMLGLICAVLAAWLLEPPKIAGGSDGKSAA